MKESDIDHKIKMAIAGKFAREFATHLRSENWVEFIPSFWDKLSDEQIKYAKEQLGLFGVHQRSDFRWERD